MCMIRPLKRKKKKSSQLQNGKSAQLQNDLTFKEKEEENYSTRAQVCNKGVNMEIWAENAISSELFLRHMIFLIRICWHKTVKFRLKLI